MPGLTSLACCIGAEPHGAMNKVRQPSERQAFNLRSNEECTVDCRSSRIHLPEDSFLDPSHKLLPRTTCSRFGSAVTGQPAMSWECKPKANPRPSVARDSRRAIEASGIEARKINARPNLQMPAASGMPNSCSTCTSTSYLAG